MFGQFPFVSPLANALAIPLVSLLITPLALSGLLDPTGTLLHWAERLFALLDWFLRYCIALPMPDLHLVMPSMLGMVLAMLGMVLLLLPRGIPARWLGGVMLLPLFFTPQISMNSNEFQFSTNLDSFEGNSGSPVLNAKTFEVEGILVNGQEDLVLDSELQCYRNAVYDGSGNEGVFRSIKLAPFLN